MDDKFIYSEDMQTRSLTTLLEISRSGSFATAAARLNMTLSAVSMQMKSLEAELDIRLFDRAFRPPKLTSIGREVCAQAARVIAAEAQLRQSCQSTGRLQGRYRMGFVPTASVRLLPDFLIAAKKRAPEAQFEIETDLSEALEARVLGGQLDAAVVTASSGAHGLTYTVLRREPLSYAAPKSTAPDPSTLFKTLPFLHFMPKSGIGKLIATHVGDKPRAVIVLDSVEAIMECVNRGLGFTLLPEPDIHRFASDTTAISKEASGLERALVLATSAKSQDQNLSPHLAALF